MRGRANDAPGGESGAEERARIVAAAKRIVSADEERGLACAHEMFRSAVREITEIGIENGLAYPVARATPSTRK